ncbi:NAD(P)-binding protein [Zopfia rhizophila CBS 207.26]|uniref:NAD(P)-binding protein n=1 Tax=Zopfia rhizophila CBS 207.26 TaxID=1314779 RepID=A0A6A6ERT8_9PEZI|nr:NAD(P)-binding protein [Zopfia rhizophila CBS 207.26]
MPVVIAVPGGSGSFGRAIVDALKADNRYEPLILGRKENPKLEQETGVRIVAADYSNIDSLIKIFEDNKVDTVISTANSSPDPTPELNLIKAADRSKVTRRFIPNVWSGIDYTAEHAKIFSYATLKVAFLDSLKSTNLEWTAFYVGIFLDYYVPGFPTYTKFPSPFCVDTVNNVAGISGSGDYPVVFTHTFDIAKFAVAALSLEKWENKYFVVGDKVSFNELVRLAEEVKGVKFEVHYDSIEKMKGGQVTEIPAREKIYELLGGTEESKKMIQEMMAQLGLFLVEGLISYEGVKTLNEKFPEIKPMKVKEALEKAF